MIRILLYTVAGLIFIIWAILLIGFKTTASVHLLLVLALVLVIFNMLFGKKLSKKKDFPVTKM
ncbi:MAG: lmo0937 family membrane protein [Bacteroidales bacterium]|nr:lmo0937 family membrane protein [Bacteroidales bacterium]